MKKIITFGTFDLLHMGHIRLLERAKTEGDYLIVGISSDSLNLTKGKESYFNQDQRLGYIKSLKCVDEVFLEYSLELKDEYIKQFKADMLVMGDDWKSKFDWVSCPTKYLPRTEGVSSTDLKNQFISNNRKKVILFADTYVKKHYACALTIVDSLIKKGITPIITNSKELPGDIECAGLVYFNYPEAMPPESYKNHHRILIDHGASNLKWFLGNEKRFNFFDEIITAGPDHTRSILSLFPSAATAGKVKTAGFIKSVELLKKTTTREEFVETFNLSADQPIVAYLPTWHKSSNKDVLKVLNVLEDIDNHIVSLHPETQYIDVSKNHIAPTYANAATDILKHADIVISDVSSTLNEATALGKKCIQILHEEYPDNPSVMYDFPYTSGTCDLFSVGMCVRPENLGAALSRPFPISKFDSHYKRVLKGTTISTQGVEVLTDEIARSLLGPMEIKKKSKFYRRLSHKKIQDTISLCQQRIIGHAGGDVDGVKYSNSEESLMNTYNYLKVIELDVVKGLDSVLIAHEGLESSYGLTKGFASVSQNEFLESKFEGKYSPLSVHRLMEILKNNSKYAVLDVKEIKTSYQAVVEEVYSIAEGYGVQNQLIFQSYCFDDFIYLKTLGVKKALLAVWKYYFRDPLGKKSYEFLQSCVDIDSDMVFGISIPYTNAYMKGSVLDQKGYLLFQSLFKRIFIHGAPQGEWPNILNFQMGIFVGAIPTKTSSSFSEIPRDFSWLDYLFLNKDLFKKGKIDEISVLKHFLDFGRFEKRRYKFSLPPDFNWENYLEKNKDLRMSGIAGEKSAKAHWVNFGSIEGRKYL